MPIARIPAEQANHNLRRNRTSLWPDDRVAGERLEGVAKVSLNPSFGFSRRDRILTLGSCFAREIELHLDALGFDLPMKQVSVPADERATKAENDVLNKYTVQSMEYELAWASGAPAPSPEKLFLELADGAWHDPQLVHSARPLPLERVIERRAMVQAAVGQFPSCRVVIITLGLAEAWFDQETSLYLNTAPPQAAIRRYPGRFCMDVLDYDDILQSLERIHALLTRHGHPEVKVLATVSPVPFKATFSGEDALTANTYSKAVQRAACQAFVARHDNVDYFPSYEVVSLSTRELAYERDNIHVSPVVVSRIMNQVLRGYAPDVAVEDVAVAKPKTRVRGAKETHFDLIARAKHHVAQREYEQALDVCEVLLKHFREALSQPQLGSVHFVLGSALAGMKRWTEAAAQFEQGIQADPQGGVVHYKLGQAYRKLGRRPEAIAAHERAVALNSARPEFQQALDRIRAAPEPRRPSWLKRLLRG